MTALTDDRARQLAARRLECRRQATASDDPMAAFRLLTEAWDLAMELRRADRDNETGEPSAWA